VVTEVPGSTSQLGQSPAEVEKAPRSLGHLAINMGPGVGCGMGLGINGIVCDISGFLMWDRAWHRRVWDETQT